MLRSAGANGGGIIGLRSIMTFLRCEILDNRAGESGGVTGGRLGGSGCRRQQQADKSDDDQRDQRRRDRPARCNRE